MKKPEGISVLAERGSLTFEKVGEKKTFKVTMELADVGKPNTVWLLNCLF